MQLHRHAHKEIDAVMCIRMRHKRDSSLPIWNKFEVMTIGLEALDDLAPGARLPTQPEFYAQVCAKGRIELGDEFYRVMKYVFLVKFGEDRRIIHTTKMRRFPISQEMSRARSLRQDRWLLLRECMSGRRSCCK
jgi:hypothetical protein